MQRCEESGPMPVEINQQINLLADLKERTVALRGYL
jgi:hypothetical protein